MVAVVIGPDYWDRVTGRATGPDHNDVHHHVARLSHVSSAFDCDSGEDMN